MEDLQKEFVPYELALRMNQLEFDEPCFSYYMNGILQPSLNVKDYSYFKEMIEINSNIKNFENVLAPLYQQAFRWFRDKYNIFPEILTDCSTEPKFCYTYTRFFGNQNDLSSEEWGWENNIGQYSFLYYSYEEAELDCLKNLCEIIEKQNENG